MDNNNQVFIITDNPLLAKRFEKEVWPQIELDLYNFSFGCSPFSSIKDFNEIKHAIKQVDLRKKEVISDLKSKTLIISLHCKQIFPKDLVNTVRCVNVHPGYNPINRGWYPQVFAIAYDLDIGATIHEIDENLDHGNIIAREKIVKYSYDTSLSLYNRVVDKEIELLKKHIKPILNNTYDIVAPEEEGVVRWRKDFNTLCELNLDEKLTMGKAIDRLRALSHGDFKNAFFIDESGRKIYVSLDVDYE